MAKSPDHDKKPTPPNDPKHEAEAQPLNDEDDIFAELLSEEDPAPGQPFSGDQTSQVDLGRASGGGPPKAPSGESSALWADLVKDQSSGGDSNAIDFDAPSDAEVAKNALGEDSDPDVLGQSVVPPGAESSRVDLFDPPPLDDPLHSRNYAPPSESEEISGLSGSRPRQPAESDINFGPDLPLNPPASASRLPGPIPTPAPVRRESTLDFGAPIAGEGELASSRRLESGIDLGSSAIFKEEPPSRIESGIDLGSADVIDMDEEEKKKAEPERMESGIDIGSAEVVDLSTEEDVAGAMPLDSGIDLGGAVALDSSSGEALEGAQIIEDDADDGGFVFPPPTGEKIAQPSSDSDIIIGADDIAALQGPSESSVNLDVAGEKGSSRDLIAEAVESGVDLTGAEEAVIDDEAVVLAGSESGSDSSSAVDLGAAIVIEEDEPAAAGMSPSDLAGAAILDDEEMVGAALIEDDESASGAHVELGGATVLEDDNAEGTLEDKGEEAAEAATITEDAEDFLGTMEATTDEATADEAGEPVAESEVIEEGLGEDAGEAPSLFVDADEEPAAEAAEAEEEEDAYVPPPPRPKYGRRWVGGTLVGMTLAAVAAAALVTFNEGMVKDLGDQMRGMIGYESDTTSGPGKTTGGGKKPGPGGQQVATVHDKVKMGDFNEDAPAIDENSVEDLAARGEYRWKRYLSKNQPPFKEDAKDVKDAIADLESAPKKQGKAEAAADAFYWQGNIQEMLGKPDAARKIYQAAADRFVSPPELQQRFKDALDRLDVLQLSQPARAPAPMGPGAGARAPIEYYGLGIDFLAGQAEKPPEVPKPLPEAGGDFWRAFKAALNLDFDNAVKSIDSAMDKHKKRRLTQIGKPQNPFSDPQEDIFIKASEQLRIFWQLQQRLQKDDYLPKKPDAANIADAPKALDTLLADLKKAKTDLDTAKTDLAKLEKDYTTIDAAKKKADMQVVTLTTERDKEKKDKETALADLATERKNLDAEKEKVAAGLLINARLEKDKQLLGETIVGVGEKVGLRDIDPVRSKSILFQRLDDMVEVAKKVDPDNRLANSIVEIRNLNATLTQRWPPEVMLGFWTPLLADRTRKDLAADALKDVERVKANAKAPLEVRSQAYAVEGLALRNQGEYGKARTALGEAMRGDVAGPTWKPVAKDVLSELSDPAVSYLPRAEELRARKRYDEALGVLDEGMKVFSDKNGELLALRSQVRLEKLVSSAKKLDPMAVEIQAAAKDVRDDAEAAIKAGAEGAGHFAAGRLADELGQRPQAELLYRKAMAELPADHPDASKARIAVARLLLQGIEPKAEPMPKTSQAPGIKGHRLGHFRLPDMTGLVVGELPSPEEEAKIKEAIRLADEVLARKDIDQFPLLKAQALAVKGMWTQALNTYVQGLQPHLSREHYEGLKYLVENHPLQRRPDVARIAHPMQGEKFYAQGLTRFYNREYALAEREFSKAIENFEQDARYHYFLGLARLAQGKLGAVESFDQGARLEADNRPGPGAVNASLERIQGAPRRMINDARERAR